MQVWRPHPTPFRRRKEAKNDAFSSELLLFRWTMPANFKAAETGDRGDGGAEQYPVCMGNKGYNFKDNYSCDGDYNFIIVHDK